MATDPNDIRLTDETRRRLACLADERGVSWSVVMSDLLESAEASLGIERGLASASAGEAVCADTVHESLRARFGLTSG